MGIMFLTKRNGYLLFPAITVLTFLFFQPNHIKFKVSSIKNFLLLSLVVVLITIPDFVFRNNHFGGFIFSKDTTFPQEVAKPEDKSSENSVLSQEMVLPETIIPQTSGVKEINYIPSSMAAQPLNIPKYLGVSLLLLLLLLAVNFRKLFLTRDLIVILPVIIYLPLFFIAFKGWLAVRYLSPIIPLTVVWVSKLFTPLEGSAFQLRSPFLPGNNKLLRQVIFILCLLQFTSTLVFVYMNRQVSLGEREAINYIKNNIPLDARLLTPDELFFSYYTERATFWRSSPLFVSEFYTLFWGDRKEAKTLLKKYGTDYMVIRNERIYDDTKIRYKMGGGFPQSFVEGLSGSDFTKVYENDEVAIWSENKTNYTKSFDS